AVVDAADRLVVLVQHKHVMPQRRRERDRNRSGMLRRMMRVMCVAVAHSKRPLPALTGGAAFSVQSANRLLDGDQFSDPPSPVACVKLYNCNLRKKSDWNSGIATLV